MAKATPSDPKPKIWAMQIRAPFLILSIVLTLVGGALAYADGVFLLLPWLLAMIGVTLTHAAVNLLNEYSDFHTGIDSRTQRTPFSGGSGNLQKGLTSPKSVLIVAWLCLLVAVGIGLYLAFLSSWWVLVLMAIGGLTTIFYTTHLAKWALGEVMAGITLGTLVVLGTYLVQAQTITWAVVGVSIPPGILTALLLLLNEFPDVEADKLGGRKHLVILLGRKKAAMVYSVAMILQYSILISGALLQWFPPQILITLLTLPLALLAMSRALQFGDVFEKIVPALGANVGVVIGTNLLIAVAYFL
jgi:1,4-dihydroxy-2-naphthoate polyprenyltransferase